MAQQEQDVGGVSDGAVSKGVTGDSGEEDKKLTVHGLIEDAMKGVPGHKTATGWTSALRPKGSRVPKESASAVTSYDIQILRVLVQLSLTHPSPKGFGIARIAGVGFTLFPGSKLFTLHDEVIVLSTDRYVAARLSKRAASGLLARGLVTRVRHGKEYHYLPTVPGTQLALKGEWKPHTLPALRRIFLAAGLSVTCGALFG